MQWFEYVWLGLVLLGSARELFVQAGSQAYWIRWIYLLMAALFLIASLIFAGSHWQLWPLYLASAISVLSLFRRQNHRFTHKFAACTALGMAVVSAALCWVLPVFSLPLPTGVDAVGTRSEVVEDLMRGGNGIDYPNRAPGETRRLPIKVWYPAVERTGRGRAKYSNADELKPMLRYRALVRTNSLLDADPVSGQTFPLILFGPRWGGARVQDTFLAEDLASHGYVVVAIDHPGNAAFADTGDQIVRYDRKPVSIPPASSAAAVEAAWADELKIWRADDEAVLDDLLARNPRNTGVFFYAIDASRIGALGHSFGGASGMALLGRDSRVKCALNLDGWTFNGLERRTTQPVMMLYEGSAQNPQEEAGPEAQLDADDRAAVTASLGRFGGTLAYVEGTQHMDFTDQTLVSPMQRITFTGPIAGVRVREITRGLVLGFFDQTLKGQGSIPAYREVTMQKVAAK